MLKLQRASTAQADLDNMRITQSNGIVSRATTAQTNVSRKKYRFYYYYYYFQNLRHKFLNLLQFIKCFSF